MLTNSVTHKKCSVFFYLWKEKKYEQKQVETLTSLYSDSPVMWKILGSSTKTKQQKRPSQSCNMKTLGKFNNKDEAENTTTISQFPSKGKCRFRIHTCKYCIPTLDIVRIKRFTQKGYEAQMTKCWFKRWSTVSQRTSSSFSNVRNRFRAGGIGSCSTRRTTSRSSQARLMCCRITRRQTHVKRNGSRTI